MKRFLLLLPCIAIMVIMSSCAPREPQLKDSFSIPVSISGTLNCSAGLNKEADSVTLTLTSPESLTGLSYIVSADGATASYNGLSCNIQGESLPDTALPQLLYTVLTDIEKAAFLRSEEGGGVYQLYGATVTICDGIPVKIDVTDPAYSITAEG